MDLIITKSQYKLLMGDNDNVTLDKQLIKDKVTIDILSKKFPQWDFSNATIRREKNKNNQTYRFLDGLYCNEHKTTNDNINVSDLLKRGSGCRECGRERQIESGMTKKPLEQWIFDLNNVGFETKLENFEYRQNDYGKNILFVKDAICKKCGEKITKYLNAWEMNSGKITCPKCSIGKWKGEEMVKEILDGMGVEYIPKYKFAGLKGKEHTRKTKTGVSKPTSLPYYYDFYLPEKNTLIEYDGQYHFHIKKDRHDDIKLGEYIKRDLEKNKYASDNEIKLIRIPYTSKIKDTIRQELEDALDSDDKFITTGDYPKEGWNK